METNMVSTLLFSCNKEACLACNDVGSMNISLDQETQMEEVNFDMFRNLCL
jgi:hypothetical protein